MSSPLRAECPCGSATPYDACCGRLHRGEAQAATPEELMRSRYSAFVMGEVDHLFRTWHPRTRPDDVSVDLRVTWTGLEVLRSGEDGDHGVVEFRAHHDGGVMHEVSRFERRAGRWFYVDGDVS
jgi:SEC-C motif-containing protein